jgi:hypothetical protein
MATNCAFLLCEKRRPELARPGHLKSTYVCIHRRVGVEEGRGYLFSFESRFCQMVSGRWLPALRRKLTL